MLGNDVVDLALALRQSNWRRQNYLSKIFSCQEQQLVSSSNHPEVTVWQMWSMKEAAYKMVNRRTEVRSYNPLAYSCTLQFNCFQLIGKVSHGDEDFHTITEISGDFVHTIAVQDEANFMKIKVIHLPNWPNYQMTFNGLQKKLKLNKNNRGLPQIIDLESGTSHLASLSHHGKRLCIAYL